MKLALPDIVSNSYFPVLAAQELGCFLDEGLDITIEHRFPVDRAFGAVRDGSATFAASSAHAVLSAFPAWRGAKLLCAQAQGLYWLLVVRADLGARQGDLSVLRGLTIGAAPWADSALRRLLYAVGMDPVRDAIRIGPVSGLVRPAGTSFGIAMAEALAERRIDGFWANGMAAELAVSRGVGTLLLDVRRGDGPAAAFHYTFPCVIAGTDFVARHPDKAAAMVRAIVRAQAALRANPDLATRIGRALFPPAEAALIAAVVARDLLYYRASIGAVPFSGMVRCARDMGDLAEDVDYDEVVATQFRPQWAQHGVV